MKNEFAKLGAHQLTVKILELAITMQLNNIYRKTR